MFIYHTMRRHNLIHRVSLPLRSVSRPKDSPQRFHLSTRSGHESQKTNPHDKPTSDASSSSQNPSYPVFSFQGLGASPTTKGVVIACLMVLGTMESIFWGKAL
jgi:hypothetical protein